MNTIDNIDSTSIAKHASTVALYEKNNAYFGVYADKGFELAPFSSTVGKVIVYRNTSGTDTRAEISVNDLNTYGTVNVDDFAPDEGFNYVWVKQVENAEYTDIPVYFWGEFCTFDNKPDKAVIGETLELSLTANDGYVFKVAPVLKLRKYGDTVTTETKEFTITESGKKAVLSYTVEDVLQLLVIGYTEDENKPPEDVTVINNIARTTEKHEYDGQTVTITVESGYLIKSRIDNPKAQYTDTKGQSVTVDMDSYIYTNYSLATVTITDIDARQPVTITGTLIDIIPTRVNLSNCVSDKPLTNYTDFNSTLNVNLTANQNTQFEDDGTSYIELWYRTGAYKERVPFVISQDKRTASITYEVTDKEVVTIVINAESFPVKIVGSQYGSINVYKVSMDDLSEFAKVRFGDSYDLGSYVNRINRIYADVPVLSSDVLRCGDYNTGIEVEQPDLDTLTLDFGNVTIPAYNDDNTDYESEIQIFLPFKGFITLNSEWAGRNINLQYLINVVTGCGVAKLSYDGVVFQVEEVQPYQSIIYRTSELELKTVGSDDWNELLFYGIEPYIYYKWYESKTSERNVDNTTKRIGDFRGFTKLKDISTISTEDMLIMEQEMIYNELENGVYIE